MTSRAIVTLAIFLTTAAAHADWVARNGNALQRGHVPVRFHSSDLVQDWTSGIGSRFAVAEGYVVSSFGNSIRAFDFDTGAQLWSVEGASFHELTIMNGAVYVATGRHSSSCGVTCSEKTYLRSYNLDDGGFRFRTEFASQWYSGWGPVPANNSLYMNGGYYGGLYEFSPTGGSAFRSLAQYDGWQPAIDDTYLYAYIAGSLQVIDPQSLTVVKSIPNPDYSWSGYTMGTIPVPGDNEDVFVRHGGRLMSFDVTNGDINWSKGEGFTGQPVYNDGVVYAIAAGALSARDAATGNQLWGWEVPAENLRDYMLLTDSHVFVQAASGTYAIDLSTHKSEWNSPYTGKLAFSDGRLFIDGATYTVVPEPAGYVLSLVAAISLIKLRHRSKGGMVRSLTT